MKKHSNLLIEIGCEELPAAQQPQLISDFSAGLSKLLDEHGLAYQGIKSFVTPRRLSLIIQQVQTKQDDTEELRKGPATKNGFNEKGEPTAATLGFAKSCGVEHNKLQRMDSDKGEYLCYKVQVTGRHIQQILPQILGNLITKLPKGRTMRWDDSNNKFVRAVRWLLLLLDDEVISWDEFGLTASNLTQGHRFYTSSPITINHCDEYEEKLLKEGYVIVCPNKRRKKIIEQANKICAAEGCANVQENELIDELVAITEYPVAYAGEFNPDFLRLPAPVLDSVLTLKQRYLPLIDAKGNTLPKFIFIANIKSNNKSQLIAGNQAVIAPRLEDAAFFYKQDLRSSLQKRLELLDKVAFFGELGNMRQKSQRCEHIVGKVANDFNADAGIAQLAASLCKCDLTTLMVQEFPELQGIIGGYYLLASDKLLASDEAKAKSLQFSASAIQEHYLPQRQEDKTPYSTAGCALAVADKLDTLIGLFHLKYQPSGEKDPYSLRRTALGIVRILLEKQLNINLDSMMQHVIASYKKHNDISIKVEIASEVLVFINERVPAYGKERGMAADALAASFYEAQNDIYAAWQKAAAMMKLKGKQRSALVEINKRLKNILAEQKINQREVQTALIKEDAEREIFKVYQEIHSGFNQAQKSGEYEQCCKLLSTLSEPLEEFFEQVMVMSDDMEIRKNRLLLLSLIHRMFLKIGDFSRLL